MKLPNRWGYVEGRRTKFLGLGSSRHQDPGSREESNFKALRQVVLDACARCLPEVGSFRQIQALP
jgi:hypothetical protein